MGLRAFVALVRRWWWMTALYVVVGVIGSLVVSALTTPVYAASTTLVVTSQSVAVADDTDYDSLLTDEQLANTYSQLLHSHPLLKKVVTSLGLKFTPREFEKKIIAEVVANTQLVALTVEDSSPERAIAIANEIVKQFSNDLEYRLNDRYEAA